MRPFTVSQLSKIIEAGGSVRITKIIETLRTVVFDSDDEYEEDSIKSWESLHALSRFACSEAANGDANDYHNLAVEFAKLDFHDWAISVLEKGLTESPYSADLLADIILYGIEYGKLDKCERAYQSIMELGKNAWGWRAYSFVIKFYLEKANKYPDGEARTSYGEQALNLANEFIDYAERRSPEDRDRAYYMKASISQLFGGVESKEAILLSGTKSVHFAPQCSLSLADSLFGRGDYDEAIKYIEKCIIAVKKPQPDINPSYAHLLFALAKTQRLLENTPESEYSAKKDEIREIYRHFHISTDAYDSDSSIKNAAKQTMRAIRIQTGINDTTEYEAEIEY